MLAGCIVFEFGSGTGRSKQWLGLVGRRAMAVEVPLAKV